MQRSDTRSVQACSYLDICRERFPSILMVGHDPDCHLLNQLAEPGVPGHEVCLTVHLAERRDALPAEIPLYIALKHTVNCWSRGSVP